MIPGLYFRGLEIGDACVPYTYVHLKQLAFNLLTVACLYPHGRFGGVCFCRR